MRDAVYDYVLNNLVSGFKLSTELPWLKDGSALFNKNLKSIYVDREDTTSEPLFDTLDGQSAVNEITTITVYVATDAKQLPSGYETLVSTLRRGRIDASFMGNTQKQVDVTTTYSGDNLITQFDFIFYKFSL